MIRSNYYLQKSTYALLHNLIECYEFLLISLAKQQSQSTALEEKRSAGPSNPFQSKANILPSQATTTRAPIFYKRNTSQAMTEAQSLPYGVPAFKPLRTTSNSNIQSMVKKPIDPATQKSALHQYSAPNLSASNSTYSYTKPAPASRPGQIAAAHQANAYQVPAFQSLPASGSRVSSGHVGSSDVKKLATSNAIDSSYSASQRVDVGHAFFNPPCETSKNEEN